MYTTQNNKLIERDSQIERRRRQVQEDVYNIEQQIDREILRQGGGEDRYRQMYTTLINRQKDTKIQSKRRQLQMDVYNIEQQIVRYSDREIVRQREGGRYRQIYTTYSNRQRERQLNREEEEVGTDRCIHQKTIDREIVRQKEGGG